jgi:hypothetical protein
MNRAVAFVLGFLLLGASLVWVARIASDTVVSVKNKGDVSVKGFAKKSIKSDLGVFQATITAENGDLQQCYRDLTAGKEKVVRYLGESGFTAGEVKFYPAQIQEKNKISPRGHTLNKIESYSLSQSVRVESGDVEKIDTLSVRIAELLNEGVKIIVSSPQFYYTGIDDLKIEMVGSATENATSRARVIASKGKFRLGSIASVKVGVFQITPANSTDVSDYGINDTSSILKEIKSVVEIRYFVR